MLKTHTYVTYREHGDCSRYIDVQLLTFNSEKWRIGFSTAGPLAFSREEDEIYIYCKNNINHLRS